MSVDGLMSLWAEGLSEWLSAGNTQDGSAGVAVAVQSMVATGVLPPRPPRCPTKPVQCVPDSGPARDDRPKQKRKVVDAQRLLGVA